MTSPNWRTVAEQAEAWRCSTGAVHSAIKRGELPATLIAGRWLIDPADADKYQDERRNLRRIPTRTRAPRRRPQRRTAS